MTRVRRIYAIACLASAAMPGTGASQSVSAVVDSMYAAYARNTEGVENYSIVQRSMGASGVSYFEKGELDGNPVYRLRDASIAGYAFSLDGQVLGYGDVLLFGPALVERGRYTGFREIDGTGVHVLEVTDLDGLHLTGPAGPDDIDFVPTQASIYVDPELWVPRGFDFLGEAASEPDGTSVRIESRMTDFRRTDGLLLPHRTVIRIDGLDVVIDPEARDRLAQLRLRLDAMPEAQRALMEEMMAEEMESLRKMMGGDGETTTIEIEVTSVRVNAGPPGR